MSAPAETPLYGALRGPSPTGPIPLGSRRTGARRRTTPASACYARRRPTRARPALARPAQRPRRDHRRHGPTRRRSTGSRDPASRHCVRLDPQPSDTLARPPVPVLDAHGIDRLSRASIAYRPIAHWTPSYIMAAGPSSPSIDGLTPAQRHPDAPLDDHKHRLRNRPDRDGHDRPQHRQTQAPEQAPPEEAGREQGPHTRLNPQPTQPDPRDRAQHPSDYGDHRDRPRDTHRAQAPPTLTGPQQSPQPLGYYQSHRAGGQRHQFLWVGGRARVRWCIRHCLYTETPPGGGGHWFKTVGRGAPARRWDAGTQRRAGRPQSGTPSTPESSELGRSAVLDAVAGGWRRRHRNPERGLGYPRIWPPRSHAPKYKIRRGRRGSTAEPPASGRLRPADAPPCRLRSGVAPRWVPLCERGCPRGLVPPEVAHAS